LTDAVVTYIGIGSNLDDPQQQVQRSIEGLGTLHRTRCISHSSLYQSKALLTEGAADQPDYINAVAKLETGLDPWTLLKELQHLEALSGRIRTERWSSRTLDLDILLYDDRIIDSPDLTIPHPGLYERNFVLYPLAEIATDLVIPGSGEIGGLLARCQRGSLIKL
jgi:2-amino-4-hydroxy-6-hydroxymethyldihydropteridine diphosphokinase